MRLAIALVLFVSFAMPQQNHQHSRHHSVAEYVDNLEREDRDEWQKPHEVVQALELKPGEVVADIGAGTGYFSRRFAHHGAKVLAVDVEKEILETHWKGGEENITKVLAKFDDPMLPKAGVDTVFFCNVIHHIEERPAYFAKVRDALKPGGRVAVVDFHKRQLPVGPGVEMKIALEAMIAEWEAAGFRIAEEHTMLPYQYFLEFRLR